MIIETSFVERGFAHLGLHFNREQFAKEYAAIAQVAQDARCLQPVIRSTFTFDALHAQDANYDGSNDLVIQYDGNRGVTAIGPVALRFIRLSEANDQRRKAA